MWNHNEMHSNDSLILLYSGRKAHIQTYRDNENILPCTITHHIYMFAFHKPGKKWFSEGSEVVVLLSVLSALWPLYYWTNLQTTLLRACEILERGGRWIGDLLSSNACILAWECSLHFVYISFSFEAIRSEYLSRTQRLCKGRPFCPFWTQHKLPPWSHTICIYTYTDTLCTSRK